MQSIPFYKVCKLLEDLESLICRVIPLLPKDRKEKVSDAWISWFKLHRDTLDAMHKDDPSVLFTLKPEALVDRDYGFSDVTFERFIARSFQMTVEQRGQYAEYAKKAKKYDGEVVSLLSSTGINIITRNDVGHRIGRIMTEIGRDSETIFEYKKVTVEEIEDALIIIAANNEGSSTAIKSLAEPNDECPLDRLENIYLRLQGSQAKWLTRIIYKNFGFVVPDDVSLSAYHTSFPRSLQVMAKLNVKDLVPIRRYGQTGMRHAYVLPESDQKTATLSGFLGTQGAKSLVPVSPPLTRPSPLSESTPSSLNVTQRPTQQTLSLSSNNNEFIPKLPARQTRRSPRHSSQKLNSPSPLTTSIYTGTGKCQQTPNCHFNNTIFILSPCISSHLWLTENLLQSHGVTYITSLRPLTLKVLPKRCPQTGQRVRKIALAEYGRLEQTRAFINQIQDLNLTRANGKHDWIEVLDWRLLEAFVAVEKGADTGGIWRRHWICAV